MHHEPYLLWYYINGSSSYLSNLIHIWRSMISSSWNAKSVTNPKENLGVGNGWPNYISLNHFHLYIVWFVLVSFVRSSVNPRVRLSVSFYLDSYNIFRWFFDSSIFIDRRSIDPIYSINSSIVRWIIASMVLWLIDGLTSVDDTCYISSSVGPPLIPGTW